LTRGEYSCRQRSSSRSLPLSPPIHASLHDDHCSFISGSQGSCLLVLLSSATDLILGAYRVTVSRPLVTSVAASPGESLPAFVSPTLLPSAERFGALRFSFSAALLLCLFSVAAYVSCLGHGRLICGFSALLLAPTVLIFAISFCQPAA